MRFHSLVVLAIALIGVACESSSSDNSAAGTGGATATQSSTATQSATASQSSTVAQSATASTGGLGGAGGSTNASSSVVSSGVGGSAPDGGCSQATYDAVVLCDHPVAFWALNKAPANEPDLTGNGNTGVYKGGAPTAAATPNGDEGADFNGSTEYLTIPSSPSMSITTTGSLTWEGWIRPDVLQFPGDGGNSGYVDWMGKCAQYAPSCEWEARMYDTTTKENPNRPNRLSAYVFNPGAGLGSAADWQPAAAQVLVAEWYHVVGEYTTMTAPAVCTNVAAFPGSINIWVNGVKWDQAEHGQTGCMSQYSVVPVAHQSALNIGSMALDTWFAGAIAKVAIYDYLLSASQIAAHYTSMTGKPVTGSCTDTCSF